MTLTYKKLTESIHNRINNVRLNMFGSQLITRPKRSLKAHSTGVILTASLALIASAGLSAQETDEADDAPDTMEELVIYGTRGTVQRSTSNATPYK